LTQGLGLGLNRTGRMYSFRRMRFFLPRLIRQNLSVGAVRIMDSYQNNDDLFLILLLGLMRQSSDFIFLQPGFHWAPFGFILSSIINTNVLSASGPAEAVAYFITGLRVDFDCAARKRACSTR
jgi:hypothetical protein